MAKKRFSSGLDDLFSEGHDTLGMVDSGSSMSEITVRQGHHDRKNTHKSFASDLDALLHEALEESLEHLESQTGDKNALSGKSKSVSTMTSHRNPTGIDALIRQTIDVQDLSQDSETGIKRLTVAVDRSKLEQLKTIARLENAYLKDLLVHLIDDYIQEYKQEKGLELE